MSVKAAAKRNIMQLKEFKTGCRERLPGIHSPQEP